MKSFSAVFAIAAFVLAGAVSSQAQDDIYRGHALSMFGDIKYGPDFTHFDYVNPDAPKGGEVRLAATGTFDSLNPFIIKGVPAAGIGMIYETLLAGSSDEPFTEYGLLVETIEMPEDRSWVAFTLRPEARWHDGKPVTVDDVIFSFEMLTTKGHPGWRAYYADVAKVEAIGERTVKFTFEGGVNRELPLIVGQMIVLPKHDFADRDFDETILEPPLGSGPYRIESLDAGRSITYRRVEDYWAKDLPVRKGQNNFDVIRYDYYQDSTVAVLAFKAGEYDYWMENNSKQWATSYDIPDVRNGRIVKELTAHEMPTGMQGFLFNTRRAKFADPRVRWALAHAFDFEWTNANLFYGQYTRTRSYFSNTELASTALPEGKELEILAPYRGRIPDDVFTATYEPPTTDGSGEIRENLRLARGILENAGWTVQDGKLVHGDTGETMAIEFLLVSPAFERVVAPFVRNLERLGVDARIRILADSSQYQNRLDTFDFDMIVVSRGQSLSPGNEQRGYWTSEYADIKGGQNFSGMKDPVVDELVGMLIAAPDRESLVAITHALDRVLLWGHYVIPNWHIRSLRELYWDKFAKPAISPKYGVGFPGTWWIDDVKLAALESGETAAPTEVAAAATAQTPETETDPDAVDDAAEEETDNKTSIYLAFAGFLVLAVVFYARRKRVRPSA